MAAMGTPTTMLASICLLVVMGMSWIMSMVRVIMSRLSELLLFLSASVLEVVFRIASVVEDVAGALVVKEFRSFR